MTDIEQTVDVVVIGPGGEEVASRLADAGLVVLGVERELVGGECPCWGCIPSKMIVRAVETLAEARRVDQLAGSAQVHPDYAPVARRIRSEAPGSGRPSPWWRAPTGWCRQRSRRRSTAGCSTPSRTCPPE